MIQDAIRISVLLTMSYGCSVGIENLERAPDYPLFAVSIERSYTPAELDKIAVWFGATRGANKAASHRLEDRSSTRKVR